MSAHKDITSMFNAYVFNAIPIYLLHLPDMRLMQRGDVRKVVAPLVEKLEMKYKGRKLKDVEQEVGEEIRGMLGYAIFSHRWLNEGEPTFSDIKNVTPAIRSREGYQKLKGFCHQATERYGCQWGWSDTCCIDKSSSADLEESIRSMFTWYKNAKVCVAYLGDATGPADWSRSAWFSRGWTLQELLAPSKLKFFVKDWEPLTNSKFDDKEDDEILQTLRRVTGIPVEDLQNFEASADRVREKLSWASKRITTRVEDMAYSLIGILDISLSISYGEGDRAFYRLQKEIMGSTSDWGLFLWTGEPSKYNSAMASSPACFARYPADAKAISEIQFTVASDVSSDLVWNDWQMFCDSNYIGGQQMAVFNYGNLRSTIYQRPGRLSLTCQSDFEKKAKKTKGAAVHHVKELQVNTINLSLKPGSDGTGTSGSHDIFEASKVPWSDSYRISGDNCPLDEDSEDEDSDDGVWDVRTKGLWGDGDGVEDLLNEDTSMATKLDEIFELYLPLVESTNAYQEPITIVLVTGSAAVRQDELTDVLVKAAERLEKAAVADNMFNIIFILIDEGIPGLYELDCFTEVNHIRKFAGAIPFDPSRDTLDTDFMVKVLIDEENKIFTL